MTPTMLSYEIIAEILQGSGKALYSDFADGEEEIDICRDMISKLSLDEKECAARTSYAYYVASASPDDSPLRELATDQARENMAMRMARRHLVQMKGNQEEAERIMKEAINFRKEKNIDLLRHCFDDVGNGANNCASAWSMQSQSEENGQDSDVLMESYRTLIRQDLGRQPMVVRGHDVCNRAVLIKFPRVSPETDAEAYLMAHLYCAERAMAATEILSRGAEEKICVLLDFADYSSSCKPPVSAMKKLIPILQTNYPERVDHIVIVEPSFWMRAIFRLLSPFMDPHTKEKIVMVNGEQQRLEKLKPLISSDQAMPFMLPDAQLCTEVDVNHYLKVPFAALYDSVKATGK